MVRRKKQQEAAVAVAEPETQQQNVIRLADWDFEVKTAQLETVDENKRILTSRLATIDAESGAIIGLVSPSYKLIQNRVLHEQMEDVGGELGLRLSKISTSGGRRATIFKYEFGEEQSKVVTESRLMETDKPDVINFGVEIINSFDSTRGATRVRAFASRLACLNGMTVDREVAGFYLEDTSPAFIKDQLERRLPRICNSVDIWNGWAQQIPNRIKVGEFISQHLSKTVAEEILKQYDAGRDKSIWGLYNYVTYYITHQVTSENPDNLRFRQYDLERVADKFYEINLN